MFKRSDISERTVNTSAGLGAVLFWSTSIALGRSLTEKLGSLTAIALINLAGGVWGSAVQILHRKSRASIFNFPGLYLLGCGSLYVLYQASLYIALGLARTHSQVLEVGLLNYLWPMLTLVSTVWIFKLKFRVWLIPGVLMAIAGVLLATSQNQDLSWVSFANNFGQNSVPYILGLVAAISWALYSTLSRKWAGDRPGNAVPLFMLASACVLGLFRIFYLDEQTVWSQRTILEYAFLAVGSNMAYMLWERAVRKGDIILVAIFSYFTPLFSTLTSTLYLGIQPGIRLWIGCAMVISGALICKLAVPDVLHLQTLEQAKQD